ncbi:hypothetical protein K8374_08520 [Pseudomonas sp. p1(2021b)]|nr:hypothetical protein [Pseudomonas sp. p1(2021b)]UBM26988.1 hypothetical protein K8374_08520 [Pseudomonas sp. p1(2021b)]
MKKTLAAVAAFALVLGTTAFLPAEMSPIASAYAKGGGGGGGHGGGLGAGHGDGGLGLGKSDGHAGKASRDHGLSGNHYGQDRNDSKGHGTATSGIAQSKDTRGLTKATAISGTTPGTHNSKGLSNAVDSSTKNDR